MSGHTLHVRVEGAGEAAIVFVHGYGCSLEDWDPQVATLSQSFRCVAVDLPGHGSSKLPTAPTIAAQAAALNDAVHNCTSGPVILVGHSMGAKVIREAYCQSPGRVVGLVLIDGALYDGSTDAALARAKAAIEPVGFAAYIRRHFEEMCPPRWPQEWRTRAVKRARALEPKFAEALYLDAVRFDPVRSLETLRRIAVPVLILQATHFDVGGGRIAMRPGMATPLINAVKQHVADAEIQIIEHSSHFPMLDAPGLVTEAVRTFAGRLMSSTS